MIDFLNRLESEIPLTSLEKNFLRTVNVRSPESLLSLAWSFPGIAKAGIDITKLSNFAFKASNHGFVSAAGNPGNQGNPPQNHKLGAEPPPAVPAPIGYRVPLPVAAGPIMPASTQAHVPVDLRKRGWPIRNRATGARASRSQW